MPSSTLLAGYRAAALALFILLAGCGGGGSESSTPAPTPLPLPGQPAPPSGGISLNSLDPQNWEINFKDDRRGMPKHPTRHPNGWSQGWVIEMPQVGQGSVHYVVMPTASLLGKSSVTLRYRIEAAEGARLLPKNFHDRIASMSLYFQRKDDNWTAEGKYEAYRWYANFATHRPIGMDGNEYEMTARFDQNWISIMGGNTQTNPQGYSDARLYASRVGFVMGGGDGLGHGVYATGQVRLVVTHFSVD
jgi:hypothetical protein